MSKKTREVLVGVAMEKNSHGKKVTPSAEVHGVADDRDARTGSFVTVRNFGKTVSTLQGRNAAVSTRPRGLEVTLSPTTRRRVKYLGLTRTPKTNKG